MSSEINRAELKKMLKKEGFIDINCDDVFDTENISINVDTDGEIGIHISFGHSDSGYHEIKNATLEQINRVILVYKEAKFHEEDYKTIKQRYGSVILKEFEKFLNIKNK